MTRTLTISGIALAVVAVIAAGLFVLPIATAQEPSPTPSDEDTGGEGGEDEDRGTRREERRERRGERFAGFRDELAADLAEQLDLPVTDIEAAFRGIVGERLDEAVAAGDLDRERADELLEAYDAGEFPGPGRGGWGGGGWGGHHGGGPGRFFGGDRD